MRKIKSNFNLEVLLEIAHVELKKKQEFKFK